MKRASWLVTAAICLAALSNPAIAQSAPSPSGQKATHVASRQARSDKDQVLTSTDELLDKTASLQDLVKVVE